jgi:AraC-like DNA-binding protein
MHEVLPIAEQPAAVRFDYFSEVVSGTFCPMHCEPGSTALGSFEADVSLARLDQLALTVIGSTPIDVHRRRSDISRVSDAWYLVKFQLEGEALICQREREAHLRPGDFVICSTAEPYSLHFPTRYREAVLAIPEHRLRERVRSPEAWLGRRMSAQEPVNGLLSQFVTSLSERLDRLDPAVTQRLEANVLDLLVTALQFGPERRPETEDLAEEHLRRVRSYIHLHLADAQLCPDRIAQAEGISTRYLHMLFRRQGESVSRFVQLQRLEACRRALERQDLGGMSVTDIAFGWGFNDSSHFNRLFKAEYGITPRAWRLGARREDAEG